MRVKYLRMVEGMVSMGSCDWMVYILRCGDGSLYTGVTKNLEARIKQHASGKGAAYTRTHLPVCLVYQEGPFTRSDALVREAKLKRLPKLKKEQLVSPA
jgi:putative endonuclease